MGKTEFLFVIAVDKTLSSAVRKINYEDYSIPRVARALPVDAYRKSLMLTEPIKPDVVLPR